ncbi:hypothetical protein GGR50DRAFT_690678 [Xylaria sp. CBS 124048]|nr:hypothetical protein GGR50DRAFT_690678 [Xylaria sp. CBS 124048]
MEPDALPLKSALLDLPIELILQIWECLSLDDALAFRLVCRQIETLLLDAFRKEFFAERRFSITYHSLQALTEISKCPRLRDHLTHLTIGLQCLHSSDALPRSSEYENRTNHNDVQNVPLVKVGVDPYKLETLVMEQNFLVTSGQLQLMLNESLNCLPKLEELVLRDRNVHRRKGIERSGKNNVLVSYGWSKILLETGIDLTDPELKLNDYDDRFVDIVFSNTLLALAKSQTRIKALTVDIYQDKMGLSSSAFSVPAFFQGGIDLVLSNLRSLDLSVMFTRVPYGSYFSHCNSFFPWQQHQLFRFLQQAPNLVMLRVQSKEPGYFPEGIIGWLASTLSRPPVLVEDFEERHEWSEIEPRRSLVIGNPRSSPIHCVNKNQFKALQELELGNMKANVRPLRTILWSLSGTLNRLTLRKVVLWVTKDDENELDSDPGKPNAWSALFSDMQEMLKLNQLSLQGLEHHTPSCSRQNGHAVAFYPSLTGSQTGPGNGLLYNWAHKGSIVDIRDFLGELHLKTVVICSKCRVSNAGYKRAEEIISL